MADLWKVEVRDLNTDKTKSTCLAFIDIPSYVEAYEIRENLMVEWDFNGKIDAKRYDTTIYPQSALGCPEMWFYTKMKLGEKTPILSRQDNSLEECLAYRNPMTRGQAMAGKPNHGFFILKPNLMKGIVRPHKQQDGLDRPFGTVLHTETNFLDKHKKVHGRAAETDPIDPMKSWDEPNALQQDLRNETRHGHGHDRKAVQKSLEETGVAPELLKQRRRAYNKTRARYASKLRRQEPYETT